MSQARIAKIIRRCLRIVLCSCLLCAASPNSQGQSPYGRRTPEVEQVLRDYDRRQFERKWNEYSRPRAPQPTRASQPTSNTVPQSGSAYPSPAPGVGARYSDELLKNSAPVSSGSSSASEESGSFYDFSPSPTLYTLGLDTAAPEKARLALEYFQGTTRARDQVSALTLARELSERNDRYGELLLGLAYRDGIGVPRDPRMSSEWIERAARQNLPIAELILGELHMAGYGTTRDTSLALRSFQAAADAGYPLAQLRTAQMYYWGEGAETDTAKALTYANRARVSIPEADFYYAVLLLTASNRSAIDRATIASSLRRAAQSGNPLAGTMYGECLFLGFGTTKDYAAAVPWIRKGVELGLPFAIQLLGESYDYGLGVAPDAQKAIELYQRAARLQDSYAMVSLGKVFADGRGVPTNTATAVLYFRRAAEAGNSGGAFNLAGAYLYGKGVQQDTNEGIRWMRQAATSNSTAQYYLGLFYGGGSFVPKDDTQSALWLLKAAQNDHPDAQYMLARAYEFGTGVEKNWDTAFHWYSQAAENGSTDAQSSVCEFYRAGAAGADWKTAGPIPALQSGANSRQPACLYIQALRTLNGYEGPKDPVRAVEILRRSAEANYHWAEWDLANAYWKGIGVPVDEKQLAYWAQRAADHGNPNAIKLLKEIGVR